MGILEINAVIARNKGHKQAKLGKTPSWWLTEVKIANKKKKILDEQNNIKSKIKNILESIKQLFLGLK